MSVCKGCGKEVLFVRDANGKIQILDAKAHVYHVVPDAHGKPTAMRLDNAFVTHFATCPDANRFSGKGRQKPEDRGGRSENAD